MSNNEENNLYPKPKLRFVKLIVAVVILVIAVGFAISCARVIEPGYTGVRITLGKIDPAPVSSGFKFKLPFVQEIRTVNTKQQAYTFSDRVWGESSEQTVVYMENVTVSYQINSDYAVWIVENITNQDTDILPATTVASAMKSAMVELATKDVTNRAKIEPVAVEKLQNAINQKYNGNPVVTIISVNVDNMDFEDSYNQAIAELQIAQKEYETQQIRIKTERENAEAEAEKTRIAAEAAANKKKIEADAEADSIKTIADAQAAANKKLAESITADLVDYSKIEKWNGELPKATGGTPIIDIPLE